jgi:23S rRNA pseudouridine1911/1915/1917 synthase
LVEILYEDNHLLIVNKPAGWVVQGASENQASLFDACCDYLKHQYNKPGAVYLGVVSRLDAPVTGVVPFARTSKSAARLSEQYRTHSAHKLYVAIVSNPPASETARLEHHLVRRESESITRIAKASDPDAQLSILEYRVVGSCTLGSILELNLITGRKHQIRCQLAGIGCSIVGDGKYGNSSRFSKGIALHCRRLALDHPTLKTRMEWQADYPTYWPRVLSA